MTIIKSKVDVNSKEFKKNYEHYQKVLQKLREIRDEVKAGNPKAIEKHLQRGKILARTRIEMILDPDTPFMELSPLA
ncbi:MAG: methylmalonyl-CoA carboxyltransferase, partial [Promethearchaeota archaeon]